MKTLITNILIIINTLFFISCSDNLVSTSNSGNIIIDKVENWNLGNQKINAIIFNANYSTPFSLGSGTISYDGSFSIPFSNPADEYLKPIDNYFSDNPKSYLLINPSDAKYAVLIFSVVDANNNVTGFIERRNFSENISENSFFTEYLYFSSNVTITGTKLNEYSADTVFSEYNVNANSGWSFVTTLFKKFTPTYTSYLVKNQEPAGGKWYYYDVNDKMSQFKYRDLISFVLK